MFKQVSVMNGQQSGNVPASRFGGNPSGATYPQHDINAQIEQLSQKIEKVIEVNITLQQKIVQLSEAISGIAREMHAKNEEISLPEPMEGVPSPHGIPPAPVFNFDEEKEEREEKHSSSTDAVRQMKLLAEQNMELIGAIREIKNKMGKESNREKFEKALHKAGAI